MHLLRLILLSVIILSCTHKEKNTTKSNNVIQKKTVPIDVSGNIIADRFHPPEGFERLLLAERSFGHYLRHLPLKEQQALVKYYNGNHKANPNIYKAVVDLPIGNKDLHQCADAIIRLRADYFFSLQQYDKIVFNLTNGFEVPYSKWKNGQRVSVKGNKTTWKTAQDHLINNDNYWSYLEFIFTYAGTLSLAKEVKSISLSSLEIGDIFIQGGSPGHAIIVIDQAINPTTKEKVFMLAQSYMPAQEIQILSNPNDKNLSPWYSSNIKNVLVTPEWTFNKDDLHRF